MRNTILFGGVNREHLVSVASAQALAEALPDADLWFWNLDGLVHFFNRGVLMSHERPFEVELPISGESIGTIEAAIDRARLEERVLVLGLHGGMAENGQLAALCEDRRVSFTGSGSAASRLAFDKVATKEAVAKAGILTPPTLSVESATHDLVTYGKLVAKPIADGSSYGLLFVKSLEELKEFGEAVHNEAYLFEPFIAGIEATCGVLEHNGKLIALLPAEIRPADGVFDYAAKYLSPGTNEICPASFGEKVNSTLQAMALKAHSTIGARGYSRSDFIVTADQLFFLEINSLPGLTKASLFPKELAAQGIAFAEFIQGQIELAVARFDN
ncbi:ATP-grasp domain-containing protein [Mesorhizobium sp. M1A.T.Ca.IN.004.03.1.1]|uniref:D-alanine--D-alanine ligase family protein n=1 Tax=Mesorhizobium sp. M1A.T.Ca.IN.004.03.1.1 TaxID=2496795 RepID=UPI000FCC7D6E|nr:ATP-grasp domain-containing protein [Mesorhizobium sp. M1A.T.Ca.IN.004.03.1.1]RUV40029.1 ATP-grasp domain-containing protein [Mesorhizobium sp. M1A.T.Ca.IN.004.03.1.1]